MAHYLMSNAKKRENTVLVTMYDTMAAADVVRVCRALAEPIYAVREGKSVRIPRRHLKTVQAYLRGQLPVENYRDGMPADFYGWRGSIYERQLM